MRTTFIKSFGYIKGLLYLPFLNNHAWVRVHGIPRLHRINGTISVGRRTTLWPGVKLCAESDNPNSPAVLTIGTCSSIGDNTQIHCCQKVSIGDYVLISWGVNILENNYHNTEDNAIKTAPVVIENRVWLGCNVIVLSGVTIGTGSIVAAGSVVTKDIPPHSLAAGNPAKVIRETKPWV